MSRIMEIVTGVIGITNLFLVTSAIALWMNHLFGGE